MLLLSLLATVPARFQTSEAAPAIAAAELPALPLLDFLGPLLPVGSTFSVGFSAAGFAFTTGRAGEAGGGGRPLSSVLRICYKIGKNKRGKK